MILSRKSTLEVHSMERNCQYRQQNNEVMSCDSHKKDSSTNQGAESPVSACQGNNYAR